ncbi:MAG: hypothetical protein INR64_08865 [Caulobacteraceae bacterium]|nr:hypothetical protein [Caulobacter sp.]
MTGRRAAALGLVLLLVADAARAASPPPLPVQPAEERARQRLLPQSHDPLWTTLAHTAFTADLAHGVYVPHPPADVRALDGKEVTVSGFMLRTDVMPQFIHYVLTRYTPVCAFCPPGAPNEAIEVTGAHYLRSPEEGLITLRGVLHVKTDGASGMFFSLDHAELL